jgi:hypothetical protein
MTESYPLADQSLEKETTPCIPLPRSCRLAHEAGSDSPSPTPRSRLASRSSSSDSSAVRSQPLSRTVSLGGHNHDFTVGYDRPIDSATCGPVNPAAWSRRASAFTDSGNALRRFVTVARA